MFFGEHLDEALSREGSVEGIADAEQPLPPSASAFAGPYGLLKSVIQATENERFAPDILPYPAAVVDGVAAQIAAQNAQIQQLREEEKQRAAAGEATVSLLPFKPSDIMALEAQRAQFFLCELLRCRLRKIETLAMAIYYEAKAGDVAPTQLRSMLSHNEAVLADRLAELAARSAVQSGLQSAPPELQYLVPHPPHAEGEEILPEPDLDQYVFCVVLDELGVVRLSEDAEQTVHTGEIFLVPYRSFRPYILDGRVRLV